MIYNLIITTFISSMVLSGTGFASSALKDTIDAIPQRLVRVSAPNPEDIHAAFITVLDAEDFKDRHVSLVEVIAETPGMTVKRLGGHGAYSTMSIRGSTSENVQVYLDGILLNSSMGGAVDLSRIPLNAVEKVEVYRGTLPVGTGGSGMGGVIRISTHNVNRTNGFSGTASIGSFGYTACTGVGRIAKGNYRALLLLNAENAENGYPFSINGIQRTRTNAHYRTVNPQVKMRYRAGKMKFNLENNFQFTRNGLPAMADSPRQTRQAGLNGWNNMLRVTGERPLVADGGIKMYAESYWTVHKERYLDTLTIDDSDRPRESEFSSQYDFDATTAMQSAGGHVELRQRAGEMGILSYKASYAFDSYSYDDVWALGLDNQQRNTRHTGGVTVAGTFYLPGDRLSLTATYHHGGINAVYHGLRKYNPTPPETTFSSWYPSLYTGLHAKVGDHFIIKTNAGYGYRIPSNFELFGNTGTHLGNTELLPERAWNADAGVRVRIPDNRNRIELTGFTVLYRDMIQAYVYSQDLVKHVNYGKTINYGIESSWHLTGPFKTLVYEGTLTWQRPTNLTVKYADRTDPNGPYYGKVLPNQTQLQMLNKVSKKMGAYTVFGEYMHMGLNYRDIRNMESWPARHVWNCGMSWRYRYYGVSFIARNLLDMSFMDLIGYPQPGRQFIVKAEFHSRISAGDKTNKN